MRMVDLLEYGEQRVSFVYSWAEAHESDNCVCSGRTLLIDLRHPAAGNNRAGAPN